MKNSREQDGFWVCGGYLGNTLFDGVLVRIFVSHSFSCFNDLKLDNTITMVPRMVSFDLVFYNLSGKVTFVDCQQGEQGFWFLNKDSQSKTWNKINHLKMLTMVSMETKVVSGHSFSDKFSEKLYLKDSKKGNRVFAGGMARNASHFAANWPTLRSNEFQQKKIPKQKWRTPTLLFTWTWRASFTELTIDHVSWCLFVQVFLAKSVRDPSWRKTPKFVLTGCFFVCAQTSLKRYSERLLLFELSNSPARIDDVFVNFEEKKWNNPHIALRRKDGVSSSHHSQRPRSYSVPTWGRRHLVLCRSVDCALASRFLAPVHVYIHFQAYWACLVVIETNEKPV